MGPGTPGEQTNQLTLLFSPCLVLKSGLQNPGTSTSLFIFPSPQLQQDSGLCETDVLKSWGRQANLRHHWHLASLCPQPCPRNSGRKAGARGRTKRDLEDTDGLSRTNFAILGLSFQSVRRGAKPMLQRMSTMKQLSACRPHSVADPCNPGY